jgi:hypothetical protein
MTKQIEDNETDVKIYITTFRKSNDTVYGFVNNPDHEKLYILQSRKKKLCEISKTY